MISRYLLAAALLGACGGSSGGGGGAAGDGGGGSSGSGGSSGGQTCADVCPEVFATGCTNGPPTLADCVSGCEDIKSGPCAADWQVLLACGGANPNFHCDADGNVIVTGCESQNATLLSCLATAN